MATTSATRVNFGMGQQQQQQLTVNSANTGGPPSSSSPTSSSASVSTDTGQDKTIEDESSSTNTNTTTNDVEQSSTNTSVTEKRVIRLERHPEMGFGFVAGSEKPVVVRFVKEGGPSEGKLQAEDQILEINGEDVSKAPRDRVIDLVKSCKQTLQMTVCQPQRGSSLAGASSSMRKSSLLTAAKKAKLKSNPSRVRFAEGVLINGSNTPSVFSSFDSCVPFMPNVLKVFLENGQTKTFKYDSGTCVQDVLNSLVEKLSIKNPLYFSLCVEHVKARRRSKLTLLDPKDSLSKIANEPGAHNLRCLFRVVFVPNDVSELLVKDPMTFEYFYNQCCNDIVQERFSPELKYEIALRLSALHILQHALSTGAMTNNGTKVNLKLIEKDITLKPFLPYTLVETMKSKELHKLLNHYLKQNQVQLCPSGQKTLTILQTKVHYLRIISELPSYGAKVFPMNIRESIIESALLISRKFGLSHVTGLRNSLPVTLARIEDITSVKLSSHHELCNSVSVEVHLKNISGEVPFLRFALEERDAEELVLTLQGYHRLLMSVNVPTASIPSTDAKTPSILDLPVFREMVVDPTNASWGNNNMHSHRSLRSPENIYHSQTYLPLRRKEAIDYSGHHVRTHSPPPNIRSSITESEGNVSTASSTMAKVTGVSGQQPTSCDSNSIGTRLFPRAVAPVRTSSLDPRIRSLAMEQQHQNRRTTASGNVTSSPSFTSSQVARGLEEEEDDSYADIREEDEDVDLPSIVSMEILESAVVAEKRVKKDDVAKRVAEMHRIVNDAQTYLTHSGRHNKETQANAEDEDSSVPSDSDFATDSLLLIRQPNDSGQRTNGMCSKGTLAMGSETDTGSESIKSTPRESPLLNRTPNGSFKNTIIMSSGSSNSYQNDNLDNILSTVSGESTILSINLTEAENELIETLKKLQAEDDSNLKTNVYVTDITPFTLTGEGDSNISAMNAYDTFVEQEIIDLTALPPPGEENEEEENEYCNFVLPSSGEHVSHSSRDTSNIASHTVMINDPTTRVSSHHPSIQVLDSLNGTSMSSSSPPTTSYRRFPPATSSSSLTTSSVSREHELLREENGSSSNHSSSPVALSSSTNAETSSAIEEFIASVSVPPPPSLPFLIGSPTHSSPSSSTLLLNEGAISSNVAAGVLSEQEIDDDDLSSLIIPPPPSASDTNTGLNFPRSQDEVIANFWRVTDDVKKIYSSSASNEQLASQMMTTLHKKEQQQTNSNSAKVTTTTIPAQKHLKVSSLTPEGTASSSSSADSGYESIPTSLVPTSTQCHSSGSSSSSSSSSSSCVPVIVPRASLVSSNLPRNKAVLSSETSSMLHHHQRPGALKEQYETAIAESQEKACHRFSTEESSSACQQQQRRHDYANKEQKENVSRTEQKDNFHDEYVYMGKSYKFNGLIRGSDASSCSGGGEDVLPPLSPNEDKSYTTTNSSQSSLVTTIEQSETNRTEGSKIIRSKPPVPPKSPSVIERRKQLEKRMMIPREGCEKQNDELLTLTNDGAGRLESSNPTCQSTISSSTVSCITSSTSSFVNTEAFGNTSKSDVTSKNYPIPPVKMCHPNDEDGNVIRKERERIFLQSGTRIVDLLRSLEEVLERRMQAEDVSPVDVSSHERKLNEARDCLVIESRSFVTSSKMFVKSCTEDSHEITQHLLTSVSLLDNMFQITQVIVMNTESQAQVKCLVDRLKEVITTFGFTINTVRRLVLIKEKPLQEEDKHQMSLIMSQLMTHATSLATCLSALMRSLRAFSCY